MNPREVVALIVATFRASPVRASGSEASYRAHELRAALELLCEALDQMPDSGPRILEVRDRWLELAQVVDALPPPAPLATIAGVVDKGRSLHRGILELLTCDHPKTAIRWGQECPRDEDVAQVCTACGAYRAEHRDERGEAAPWKRPALLEALGKAIGVLS